MTLSMREKKSVTKEIKKRYTRATKKDKTKMLDEFAALTGYNRSYAARISRAKPKGRRPAKRVRARPRVYSADLMPPLRRIWAVSDMICGKRLQPILPELLSKLEEFQEIAVDGQIREKLIRMSAATIDRLLSSEKKKLRIKGRAGTKPGTLLKSQIPIRTFADWDKGVPGFVEIDLVGHDGGNSSGDFCQTLDVTDVKTGWTETRAVKNKAQVWVFAALKDIREDLPFPILGIDSDNGSEFINAHLLRFCDEKKITFTRSRPNRKNDNCFVEQKNYSVVRRSVGYLRYDTDEELSLLNELYGHLRLYTNFFSPSMKCVKKERIGSKTRRRYDTATTPYRRVLASEDITDEAKRGLEDEYATLNPAELKRRITRLQNRLIDLATYKLKRHKTDKDHVADLEYISDEATNKSLEYILK